ncbi:MAG: transposase [Fibromonadales bacterium]|nr:transposase [Fibromonadales bacterium]
MFPDKYKNKYRIPTNRLFGRDYGANGCYYITICTKNRMHYFGEIVLGTLQPPPLDVATTIVETDNYPSLQRHCATSLPCHCATPLPCNATLHSTQIGEIAEKYWIDISNHFPFVVLDKFIIMPNHVHGILFFAKNGKQNWEQNEFGKQSQNLGSVIRAFKSSLKRYANENNIIFAWQDRYYDSIIRTEKELNRVRKYINDNPANWKEDSTMMQCHKNAFRSYLA